MQTFGWFVRYGTQPVSEHLLVFWAGPLLGGLLAGLTWRVFVEAKLGQPQSNCMPVETQPVKQGQAMNVKKTK